MINNNNFDYEDDEYTSVWIGCDFSRDTDLVRGYFYDDIERYYYNDERDLLSLELPCMGIGEAFEFSELNEDFWYIESFELSEDIDTLFCNLSSIIKIPKELIIRRIGEKSDIQFNYVIVAPNMRYDGHIREINNEKYGKILFLGVINE